MNYAAPNQLPIGCFDETARGKDSIYVRGWAFDPDAVGTNIEVHIYVGGPAGTGKIYIVKADKKRDDVDNFYKSGAYHGFEATLPVSGTDSTVVYAYAIDANNKDWHTDLGGKTTALDIGNNVCGLIMRTDIWKPIRNTGTNIELWDENGTADYYWLFKRQSDGSYIIQSLYDGSVLDAWGFGTAEGTNVVPHLANGGDNQKWYIYNFNGCYRIVPKYSSAFSLDVIYAGSANGTNICICSSNESVAQRFSIYVVPHSTITGINIASGYNQNMYIGEKQTLKFDLSPGDTKSNMVTWESSNASVAAVDNNGIVTAKNAGTATIKCTSTYNKDISASIKITVKKKEIPTTEATTAKTTESVTETPTTEKTTERVTETPTTEKTTERVTETPITEKTTEALTTERPTTERSTTERVTTERATTERATTERATTERQTTERVTTERATTERPTTEKPTTERATTERPTTERPAYEKTTEVTTAEKQTDKASGEEYETIDSICEKGTILRISKNKCIVEVTSDDEDAPTVEYLESSDRKAKNIVIPKTVTVNGVSYKVTSVAEYAFEGNRKITKVTIGDNVEYINDCAFANCKNLTNVTIGKSVKRIGKKAFYNCKKLKKITIKGTKLSSVGKQAFKKTSKKVTVRVPKGMLKEYKKLLKKAGIK